MAEANQNEKIKTDKTKAEKPKKKRKILPTLLLISLALNLILGAVLNYKWNDDSEFEQIFNSEITFAIQRLEECEKKMDEGNYMVGVAHLYTASEMVMRFDENNMYYGYSSEFDSLWNMAAAYPKEFQKYIDDMIPILKDLKKDRNFNDSEALIELQELNSLIRVNVVK